MPSLVAAVSSGIECPDSLGLCDLLAQSFARTRLKMRLGAFGNTSRFYCVRGKRTVVGAPNIINALFWNKLEKGLNRWGVGIQENWVWSL